MQAMLLNICAAVLLLYSLWLAGTSNFNMGLLLVWLLTGITVLYALFHKSINLWFQAGVGRVVFWVLVVGLVLYALLLGFVALSGYTNPVTGQEKIVVVLGAGLRGDKPSLLLRYRLDAAYDFAEQHPEAVVITTGGQGRDEWVPEGQAMRDYLIEKGLDPARVLQETKSTSTEENFLFAREILAQNGIDPDQPIAYVTNAFHCYRGGAYARMAGFETAHAIPAGLPATAIPPCYLREGLAVLYYWAFRSSQSGFMQPLVGLLSLNKKIFYK